MPKPNPSPPKKKQHYIPQFYLRGFAGRRERIWVLDKSSGRSWGSSVGDAAHENYFYDLPETDGGETDLDPQFLENWLAERESRYCNALEQTLLRAALGEPPRLEDQVGLATFIVDLVLRTPEYREYRRQSTEGVLNALIHEIIEKNRENFAELGLADARPPRAVCNEETAPLYHAEALLDHEQRREVVESLLEMIWVVGEAPPGLLLPTSDCPVARTVHQPDVANGGGAGVCSHGIELTLPLNRHHVLHLFERSFHADLAPLHGTVRRLTSQGAHRVIEIQTLRSTRFLYSADGEWATARAAMADSPDCCDPKRPRLTTVTMPGRSGEHGDLIGQMPL